MFTFLHRQYVTSLTRGREERPTFQYPRPFRNDDDCHSPCSDKTSHSCEHGWKCKGHWDPRRMYPECHCLIHQIIFGLRAAAIMIHTVMNIPTAVRKKRVNGKRACGWMGDGVEWTDAHQSKIRILRHSGLGVVWQNLAAMEALLKTQNPCASFGTAWCPGGRMTAMAFLALPKTTASQHLMSAPTASLAL